MNQPSPAHLLREKARRHAAPLVGVVLIVFYFGTYRPLSKTVLDLDEPLDRLSQRLTVTNAETLAVQRLDPEEIAANLLHLQTVRTRLSQTKDRLLARVRLEPAVQARVLEPFQLIDFQNERQFRIEELAALAKQHQVRLDRETTETFPSFEPDREDASRLWAELEVVHQVVAAAIHAKVASVNKVHLAPLAPEFGPGPRALEEIRVVIELTGPMAAISRFLSSLPLTSSELRAAGLGEALPSKPALFIDRIVLRKDRASGTDSGRLDLVVAAFVDRQRLAQISSSPPVSFE